MSEDEINRRIEFVSETLLALIEKVVNAHREAVISFAALLSVLTEKGIIDLEELKRHRASLDTAATEIEAFEDQKRALIEGLERLLRGEDPEDPGNPRARE